MKKIIIYVIISIGKLCSLLYTLSVHYRIVSIIDLLYTSWLSNLFKEFGEKSIIQSRCQLLGCRYIKIGKNVNIGRNTVLTAWDKYKDQQFTPEIFIGSKTSIGEYAHISAVSKIIIGESVLTGRWLTIVDNFHGTTDIQSLRISPSDRSLYSKGIIQISDNVWIGDKVTILPGVTIGENSVIGANSVVTKSIPTNCIAAGNPAKIIKYFKGHNE